MCLLGACQVSRPSLEHVVTARASPPSKRTATECAKHSVSCAPQVTGATSLAGLTTSGSATLASLKVNGVTRLVGATTGGPTTLSSLVVTGAGTLGSLKVNGNSVLTGTVTGGATTLASLKVNGISTLGKVRAGVRGTASPAPRAAYQLGSTGCTRVPGLHPIKLR